MADDGLFFKKFAELHPKYKTPFWAIIFQSIWTIVLLILLQTFSNLITFVVFIDTAFFFLAAATYFFLIKRKSVIGIIAAIIFLAMTGFIVVNTLIEKPRESIIGMVFLAVGSIVFLVFKKIRKV